MARVELITCSIIGYRRGEYVLYPLERDKERIKPLHGKEVYVTVFEELYQSL